MDIIYAIWLRNMKRYIRSKSRIIGSISMPLFSSSSWGSA